MRQLLITLIVIIMVMFPQGVIASEDESLHTWKELNQTSDRILQLVKVEQYEEAKHLLQYFSELFMKLDLQEEGLTMTSLQIVTTTYEKAEIAMTQVDMSVQDRIYYVMTFRLAIDALSSEYHPLWQQTKTSVLHAIDEMTEAVEAKDGTAYQHRLNDLLRHYYMIRPALMIDLREDHIQKIDSQISFLEKKRTQFDDTILVPHLKIVKEEWIKLYDQVKEDSTDPSLWWVMMTIGSMITLSLSYAGWRKYRAEKRKVRMKQ